MILMQRLGIFGGTFNPPHKGHIYIVKEALIGAKLDKVIFMPCLQPPHKSVAGDVSAEHRYEMTKLAIQNEPRFEISDLEIKSGGPSYTAKTLEILKKEYPTSRLCFVLGGDSLRDLEKWYHPERIFSLAEIVALRRGGIEDRTFEESAEAYRSKYDAEITVVDISPVKVSSSEIRKLLSEGRDVRHIMDEAVLEYIQKQGIYKDKD